VEKTPEAGEAGLREERNEDAELGLTEVRDEDAEDSQQVLEEEYFAALRLGPAAGLVEAPERGQVELSPEAEEDRQRRYVVRQRRLDECRQQRK
jgi:hypothetical protein